MNHFKIKKQSALQNKSTAKKEFLSRLRTRAWRTAGARYNAARRLRLREKASTCTLAAFSAISIVITVVEKVCLSNSNEYLNNRLDLLSIALGLFILVTSLLEWGNSYGARADALHRNAEELNAYQAKIEHLISRMESGEILGLHTTTQMRKEYEIIKNRCSYNHEPHDDKMFIHQQRHSIEFKNQDTADETCAVKIKLKGFFWHIQAIWYYLIMWVVVFIAIYASFSTEQSIC